MRRVGVWVCGVGAATAAVGMFAAVFAGIWTFDGRWWATAAAMAGMVFVLGVTAVGLAGSERRAQSLARAAGPYSGPRLAAAPAEKWDTEPGR